MKYDIAGLTVELNNRCSYTDIFCFDYLSPDQTAEPDLSVTVSKDAFFTEKAQSPGYSDGYIENICLYRELCLRLPLFDRFLLHAAVLDYEGGAYAFLGKSGVGKSTHTGLWLKYLEKAKILNGDKPILRLKDGEFLVYGTPWNGKEGRGEKSFAPLKALCFLEQAKANSVARLSEKETSARLFSQILLPSEADSASRTLELVDALIRKIPAYLLKCDISETAVKTSFECLTGKPYMRRKDYED